MNPIDLKLAAAQQAAEDKQAKKLATLFLDAVQQSLDETDWDSIERQIASYIAADDIAGSVALKEYSPIAILRNLLDDSVTLRFEYISDVIDEQIAADFRVTSAAALDWLEKYGADEIKYISATQRAAIKDIIVRGYSDGRTYQEQARDIKRIIGLDPRMAEAVANMRARLAARGKLTDAQINRQADRYAQRLLGARAKTIATQEALTAGAQAFYEATADACKRGIIDTSVYEGYRIVTGDERTCPICGAVAGESRILPNGTYSSNGSVTPKLHLKCRCEEGLREIAMKTKEMKESGRGRADVSFEARSLKRKDGVIYCPTVPLIEGVYDGWGFPVLRPYEEFSKDAKWLTGLTVLTNHEALTPDARRVGQLSDIKPNESGKKVTATTQFYERDLTQREIESITSMEPLHGSLGFSCCLEMTGGEWNGQHYDAVERGPYVFYEYSLVRQGVVTPEDGAGFNMECANHQNTEAPGGADMDANELRQIIEEAQKPLMDRIAALEQTNTELQGELVGMKEQGKIDKAVATVERFAAKLKPGFQESAAELFEASQKDPLWITENADKFIQAGQESRLQGKATTEGAVAVWSLEKARAQAKLDGKVI